MANLFGKVTKMQEELAKAQEDLARITVSSEIGGGLVKVTALGTQRIADIQIDDEAADMDDIEMLQDLIVAGVNRALEEAAAAAQEHMRSAAGNMLPPGMDLSRFGL